MPMHKVPLLYSRRHIELGLLKRRGSAAEGTGPAAEGKAVGPSLKLEVGLRRKSLEHAMHPARGRRILRASPSAAGPLANSMT